MFKNVCLKKNLYITLKYNVTSVLIILHNSLNRPWSALNRDIKVVIFEILPARCDKLYIVTVFSIVQKSILIPVLSVHNDHIVSALMPPVPYFGDDPFRVFVMITSSFRKDASSVFL